MAPTKEGGIDVFAQLNDLFHQPEVEEELKKEPYAYHEYESIPFL
jgi:hypothetical protein